MSNKAYTFLGGFIGLIMILLGFSSTGLGPGYPLLTFIAGMMFGDGLRRFV